MARPAQRLSLYPQNPGETPVSHREHNALQAGSAQNFTAQKSQVLNRLAETLVELDRTEALHFDALFHEEQEARQRYVQQFQSIAGKVQQLSEELEVDRGFRSDYQSSIARYTQEQSQEIDAFALDMVQLRDLEHMVRGHLPMQLEALASLAGDIQIELKQKADMNATKSRLTQINQRLARLEEVIETKADHSALEAQQERMAAIIPDRNRLARAFDIIGPAIREASARGQQNQTLLPGQVQAAKGKAKSKAGEDVTDSRRPSIQTASSDPPAAPPQRPSESETKAKGPTGSGATAKHGAARPLAPHHSPSASHEGKAHASHAPSEGKTGMARLASSKAAPKEKKEDAVPTKAPESAHATK